MESPFASLLFAVAATAGLVTAGTSICVKGAQQHDCRPRAFALVQLSLAAVLSVVVALLQGAEWSGAGFWALGAATGALMYVTIPVMIAANHVSPPSLVWAMANMGLLIPIAGSAVFLHEPLRPLDAMLLSLFAGMLLAFQRGTQVAADIRRDRRGASVLLLAAVLAANGLLMLAFKLNGVYFPHAASARFSAVMYATAAVLAVTQFRGWRALVDIHPREWRWGSGGGLASGASILLLLPTMKLPAGTVFPIVQGASLLGGTLLTAWAFREQLNRWKLTGILLGLAVLGIAVVR